MNSTALEPLNIEGEQLALLLEVLESAHARMLVGIRHELRHRLEVVEQLIERCPHKPVLEPRP